MQARITASWMRSASSRGMTIAVTLAVAPAGLMYSVAIVTEPVPATAVLIRDGATVTGAGSGLRIPRV